MSYSIFNQVVKRFFKSDADAFIKVFDRMQQTGQEEAGVITHLLTQLAQLSQRPNRVQFNQIRTELQEVMPAIRRTWSDVFPDRAFPARTLKVAPPKPPMKLHMNKEWTKKQKLKRAEEKKAQRAKEDKEAWPGRLQAGREAIQEEEEAQKRKAQADATSSQRWGWESFKKAAASFTGRERRTPFNFNVGDTDEKKHESKHDAPPFTDKDIPDFDPSELMDSKSKEETLKRKEPEPEAAMYADGTMTHSKSARSNQRDRKRQKLQHARSVLLDMIQLAQEENEEMQTEIERLREVNKKTAKNDPEKKAMTETIKTLRSKLKTSIARNANRTKELNNVEKDLAQLKKDHNLTKQKIDADAAKAEHTAREEEKKRQHSAQEEEKKRQHSAKETVFKRQRDFNEVERKRQFDVEESERKRQHEIAMLKIKQDAAKQEAEKKDEKTKQDAEEKKKVRIRNLKSDLAETKSQYAQEVEAGERPSDLSRVTESVANIASGAAGHASRLASTAKSAFVSGVKSAVLQDVSHTVTGGRVATGGGKGDKGGGEDPAPFDFTGPPPSEYKYDTATDFNWGVNTKKKKKSQKKKKRKAVEDDEDEVWGEREERNFDEYVEVEPDPPPIKISNVVQDIDMGLQKAMKNNPMLAAATGTAIVGPVLAGVAKRVGSWMNTPKQSGPNVPTPAPPKKKQKKKDGVNQPVDVNTPASGGSEGQGRGASKGRKTQNESVLASYVPQQVWDKEPEYLEEAQVDPSKPPKPKPKPPYAPPGDDPLEPGHIHPAEKLPENVDRATDTLRPRYGMLGPRDVIPSPIDQLRSDIAFDMFSFVQPGFGEGRDNKLFQYQNFTQDVVQNIGRKFLPRPDDGRLNYQHPMPFQWQPVQDVRKSARLIQNEEILIPKLDALTRQLGEGSSAVLGRDVPEVPLAISSQGLRRDIRCPLEPTIQNADNMQPTVDPAGYWLQNRGFRRLFSPWREPQTREVQTLSRPMPHYNKRRSLEVVLP